MSDASQVDFELKSEIDDPADLLSGIDQSEIVGQPQIADIKIPISLLLQQVGAKLKFTAGQTIPDDNTFNLPTQDGVAIFDTGSHVSGGRYTVGTKEAGLYVLTATLRLYSPGSNWAATEEAIAVFHKNAVEIADASRYALVGDASTRRRNIGLHDLVSLNDGDVVDVRIESQITEADLTIDGVSTFAVARVGPPSGTATGPT